MSPTPLEDADAFLRALPAADRHTWGQLPGLFGSDDALAAATTLLTTPPQPEPAVVYGALLVYSQGGASVDPLIPLLQHAAPLIRVTAAGALLARGDARGFPAAIAEIASAGAWRLAAQQLARWTADATLGPPLDATADQLAEAAARINAWWSANGHALRFDGGRWRRA